MKDTKKIESYLKESSPDFYKYLVTKGKIKIEQPKLLETEKKDKEEILKFF